MIGSINFDDRACKFLDKLDSDEYRLVMERLADLIKRQDARLAGRAGKTDFFVVYENNAFYVVPKTDLNRHVYIQMPPTRLQKLITWLKGRLWSRTSAG